MRLTWRDGAATVLAALVVAVLLALTQGWSWPLLGDYRAGVAALAVIGFVMCSVGLRVDGVDDFKQPLMIVASVLGAGTLGLIVFGLFLPTEAIFVGLGIMLLALWVLTTVDHALPAGTARPLRSGT
jgi:hypothetical protein